MYRYLAVLLLGKLHNKKLNGKKINKLIISKGCTFLKKLWYCIGERVQQGNLVLLTELIM